jgi:hypothetical protein
VVPLLAGCTSQNAELPDPSELYAAIADAAELPEMYRIPQELISDYYGIEPDWYISIVAYKCQDILRPDEIVIVKAVSEKAAEDVMARLEAWMAYKEKSAENYFSETVSSIHNGVIRQDGLTVSLLVASDIDSVINVFDSL